MDKNISIRIPYLDIAKGLLIICVVITHTPAFAKQYGVSGLEWLETLRPMFNSYFMPAFFCITGYCTNFDKGTIFQFTKRKFKSLIVPNVMVSLGIPLVSLAVHGNHSLSAYRYTISDLLSTGGFWFLDSLFLCSYIYIQMHLFA